MYFGDSYYFCFQFCFFFNLKTYQSVATQPDGKLALNPTMRATILTLNAANAISKIILLKS